MKTHTRNLILASVIYLAAFIVAVIIAMVGDFGAYLFDDYMELDPDTTILIASVFLVFLASFAAYLAFYLIQRNKVKTDPNAPFLGLFPRIIGAFLACALSIGIGVACLFWTTNYGDIVSILYANTTLFGIIIGMVVVVNFVNFILFKPRV